MALSSLLTWDVSNSSPGSLSAEGEGKSEATLLQVPFSSEVSWFSYLSLSRRMPSSSMPHIAPNQEREKGGRLSKRTQGFFSRRRQRSIVVRESDPSIPINGAVLLLSLHIYVHASAHLHLHTHMHMRLG